MRQLERNETFGTALRNYRQMTRVTQAQLAKLLAAEHVGAPTAKDLTLYESDKSLPRLVKFAALCDTLNLTTNEIVHLVRLAERRRSQEESN